jgi:hypothetical protein
MAKAETSPSNGESDPALLNRVDALAYARIDSKTLARWEKKKLVVPIFGGAGRPLYDVRELDRVKAEEGEEPEPAELVDELRKVITDLAAANAKLLGLVTDPAKVFTDALNKHCEYLAKKDEKHEEKWLDVLKLSEELISSQHERVLSIKKHEATEKRKDEFVEIAKKVAPSIVDQFILQKFRSFLGKLGPERLGFMLDKESEFLSPELREELSSIVVALRRTEPLKGETNEQRKSEQPAPTGDAEGAPAEKAHTGESPGSGNASTSEREPG